MTDSIHDWDGAYVTGALAPEDRRRYEAHLAGCTECAAAVQRLAGLPGILGLLDDETAVGLRDLPDDGGLHAAAHTPGRAAGVARRVARRRRRTLLGAGALLALVLAAGGLTGWAVAASTAAPARLAAARTLTPVGDSHLFARLSATPSGWGTRLDWSCDYRAPAGSAAGYEQPVSYSLVVRTTAGAQSTVATWTSDAGEARDLVASTAIPVDTIERVDIRVTGTSSPLAEARF